MMGSGILLVTVVAMFTLSSRYSLSQSYTSRVTLLETLAQIAYDVKNEVELEPRIPESQMESFGRFNIQNGALVKNVGNFNFDLSKTMSKKSCRSTVGLAPNPIESSANSHVESYAC